MEKEKAKDKAKDLKNKLMKGKCQEIILKLDAFSKQLPRDIPKDDKFSSGVGVGLSLIQYAVLAVVGYWFIDVIQSAGKGIKLDVSLSGELTQ